MNLKEQLARFPKLEQISSTYGTRYYRLPNGELGVSVTTALKILDKPQLFYWALGEQSKQLYGAAEDAFMELTRTQPKPTLEAFKRMMSAKAGQQKAHEKLSEAARNIGVQAHKVIEYRLRRRMGEAQGDEPRISDPAMVAVLKFESWARDVGLEPIACEFQVWDEKNHWAGTADFLARLGDGRLILGDWKVSNRLFVESNYQSGAYRQGVSAMLGLKEPLWGMIVRLPKTIDNPTIEIKERSPETLKDDLISFRACLWLWKATNNFDPKMKEIPLPRIKKLAPVPEAPVKRWMPKPPIAAAGFVPKPYAKAAGR